MKIRFFVFILIFLLLAFGLGYYFYEKNVYSRGSVYLEILGPIGGKVQAFKEVEYVVQYKNKGNVILEDVELVFNFPEESLPLEGQQQRVVSSSESIYPGEEKSVSFKAVLLGKEGDHRKAEAILRYRPKGLKAFFEASTSFVSVIDSLPINFEIDIPSKTESGKEIQLSFNYFSNSEFPLNNLRVKAEYPSGFEFISSRPNALEKTEWDLPLLNKAEGGRIEVRGKIFGEIKEQKNFKITLGLWKEGKFIILKEITRGTEILKPAISLIQQINGSSEYVASPGDLLHYEIFFRNIGQDPFEDLFLVVKLNGNAFDFDTLRTDLGKFNKGDNFIMWDWRDVPKLKFLEGGEEGKVEFWITLKDNWQRNRGDNNFTLKNEVMISQVRQVFETKISSRLEFSQEAYFNDEVFGNSGPFPPAFGQTTTYTVIWRIKNYYNEVKGVTVKASLPSNVRLTGKIFPEDASLTYDSVSREIVWSLGDLSAGAGISGGELLVAFQVAFSYESQGDKVIISKAQVSGQDDWTESKLTSVANELTIDSAK